MTRLTRTAAQTLLVLGLAGALGGCSGTVTQSGSGGAISATGNVTLPSINKSDLPTVTIKETNGDSGDSTKSTANANSNNDSATKTDAGTSNDSDKSSSSSSSGTPTWLIILVVALIGFGLVALYNAFRRGDREAEQDQAYQDAQYRAYEAGAQERSYQQNPNYDPNDPRQQGGPPPPPPQV